MPRPGQLLIASPVLAEPFHHAVVWIVEHDESGTLGVTVNQPSTLDVGAVLPGWSPHVRGEPFIYDGGPVARDSALGLAAMSGPDEPPGFRRIAGSLGLIDLDVDAAELAPNLAALRIFAGYAGWSPGQLEGELAEGAWAVVDPIDAVTDVFPAPEDDVWARLLRSQPGTLPWWVLCPRDPAWN